MNDLCPKLDTTRLGNPSWEWVPKTFRGFLEECEHVASHCRELGHLLLYRGHRERKWLLDSTFARACKTHVFGIEPWEKLRFDDFRLSAQHQQIVLNLFFFKFDFVARPSQELYNLQEKHGIDPWFEFMKHLQQYPEEDRCPLPGSFLIDWTQNQDVGIYFADESRDGEGALWICDATATGKTLHRDLTVEEILKQMEKLGRKNASMGVPLIFYPKKQLAQKRAANQDPVYIAQMDLRVDLSEVWDNLQKSGERILVKLVLPAGTNTECSDYLATKGVNREFLFPD